MGAYNCGITALFGTSGLQPQLNAPYRRPGVFGVNSGDPFVLCYTEGCGDHEALFQLSEESAEKWLVMWSCRRSARDAWLDDRLRDSFGRSGNLDYAERNHIYKK